jgi:NCAIR mutase (PurE)-related protein
MTMLEPIARFDHQRPSRTGIAEAILCEPKSAEAISAILAEMDLSVRQILLTRLSQEKAAALSIQGLFDYDPLSRTAIAGASRNWPPPRPSPQIEIVTGGTADLAVAHEARRTLLYHGVESGLLNDLGVAGLWRLTEQLDRLKSARIIIACAGMEAALPTVLSGLVPGLIIATPVSCGYGVGANGQAALNSLLASCGPGIAVTNIDNGFGAACIALRALNLLQT